MPLLAVPPVIPLNHDDPHMSETQVGLLIGIPLSMFALAAIPGSLLIARFGVLVVATCGLAIATLASAARAAVTDIWTLYAATLAMGFGVAIFQPAFPTLVRVWSPSRAWLANAVSTNGMLMGVTFTAALSIPVVLPLVGQSWRYDLLDLVGAGPCHDAALHRRAPPPDRHGRAAGRRIAVDAELAQPRTLAARHRARRQQRAVLRLQRLRAGLPHPHRPRRHDWRDPGLAQRRATDRLVHDAVHDRAAAAARGRSRSSGRSRSQASSASCCATESGSLFRQRRPASARP
jgi:MFS family permease